MKIARFSYQSSINYGIVDEGELVVLAGDPMFAGFDTTGERVPLADAVLLAPVIPRSKVVAVGGNEVPAEPMLFLQPNTSVIGPADTIVRPKQSQFTSFEGELAVVIGSIAKNVTAERADEVIFGYTVANDITARDLQKTDGQWARAKGFDTFCPLGPVIETEFDVAGGRLETRLNGEIVAYASAAFTLLPGDVILTGTPAGVGAFVAGDNIEVEIPGIGILRNSARDA